MATHTGHRVYRAKPPSQLARDRKRAEERKNNKVGGQQSPSALFQPTPSSSPQKETVIDNTSAPTLGLRRQADNATYQSVTTHKTARDIREDIGLSTLYEGAGRDASMNQLIDSQQQQAPENTTHDANIYDDNAETEHLDPPPGAKEYIGSVTDKPLLRRLKYKHRNTDFRKTVLDTRTPEHFLLCDSDDIVIMYNCSSKRVHHWFVKQTRSKLISIERECMDNIKRWEPPDRDCTDDVTAATHQLHYLSSVIRDLLG